MNQSLGGLSERAQRYIEEIGEGLDKTTPRDLTARVRSLVHAHDEWRARSISLNAAENVLSARARALLDSDLASRITEGFPGDKDFPAHRQNRFIDEIEAYLIHMLRRQFGARHVEWRAVSTSMANATVFLALTEPGDILLAQPEFAGGNYSYNVNGPPRACRLNVVPLPFNDRSFEVDVTGAVQKILEVRPKLIALGGSNVLFPYPVAELRSAADKVGARILYDAAHVALYLAHGMFQDPLREGADILTFSSHKIMSGPVGGVILTNDDELAERILPYSFPTLIQTRDQNKYAAFAQALAEMAEHGLAYSRQTLANARALGAALEKEGFEVLCSDRGYTQTHQIFMLISDSDSLYFEDACQQANLLVTRAQRMGADNRPAVRLTTQEITRRGMTEADMPVLARWLRQIILDRIKPQRVAQEVEEFSGNFRVLKFSFDSEAT